MYQLDALAQPGELHQMLAYDVAGAQAGVVRLRPAPLRGRAQGQCSARWRVLLLGVVRFDDVAVPAGQRLRRALHQFVQYRHAQAEVRGPYQRDLRRCRIQRLALRAGNAGGTRHQPCPAIHAQRQQRVEALRQAEVNGHVEHRRTGQFAGREERHTVDYALGRRATGHGGHDLQGFGMFGGQPQQGLAHAPGGTVNEQSQGSLVHACRLAAARPLRQAPSLRCCMPLR